MKQSGEGAGPSNGDDRSAIAKATDWASKIMTISLGMVLPGIFGYWIDQKLATRAVFTLVGFGLGVALGIWQLALLGVKRRPDSRRPPGAGD